MEEEGLGQNQIENQKVVMRMPIGYRFRPTDEEVVVHYLRRKVLSLPLPAFVIPDHIDVFRTHPSHLPFLFPFPFPPGESKEKRYFFSRRKREEEEKKGKIVMMRRRSSNGGCYWKVIGKEKQIVTPAGGIQAQTVGSKKKMAFYQGGKRSGWMMNQYRLLQYSHHTCNPIIILPQKCMVEMQDWVVCCIYEKKRKAKGKGKDIDGVKCLKLSNDSNKTRKEVMNMMMIRGRGSSKMDISMMMEDNTDHLGPPQPSSSCSSGITEEVSVSSINVSSSSSSPDQEASSSSSGILLN